MTITSEDIEKMRSEQFDIGYDNGYEIGYKDGAKEAMTLTPREKIIASALCGIIIFLFVIFTWTIAKNVYSDKGISDYNVYELISTYERENGKILSEWRKSVIVKECHGKNLDDAIKIVTKFGDEI